MYRIILLIAAIVFMVVLYISCASCYTVKKNEPLIGCEDDRTYNEITGLENGNENSICLGFFIVIILTFLAIVFLKAFWV